MERITKTTTEDVFTIEEFDSVDSEAVMVHRC